MAPTSATFYLRRMDAIALVITSTAAAGKREELFSLYEEHLAPRADSNDGQTLVLWCADEHDPDRFVLIEVYRDADALGANAGADWFAAYMEQAMPLMAGEPVIVMAEPRWTKGL